MREGKGETEGDVRGVETESAAPVGGGVFCGTIAAPALLGGVKCYEELGPGECSKSVKRRSPSACERASAHNGLGGDPRRRTRRCRMARSQLLASRLLSLEPGLSAAPSRFRRRGCAE